MLALHSRFTAATTTNKQPTEAKAVIYLFYNNSNNKGKPLLYVVPYPPHVLPAAAIVPSISIAPEQPPIGEMSWSVKCLGHTQTSTPKQTLRAVIGPSAGT